MTASDPWTGATWKVYGGSQYLKPTDRVGEFTLTAVADPVTGATAYYRVGFTAGKMPKCWQGLLLYPLGSVAFPPPVPLLPPWSQSTDELWSAAADTALEELTDSMSQLVGNLTPGTNAQALTLVRVDDASTQGAPLLAMQLGPDTSGAVEPDEDGTAHGTH